MRVIVVAVGRIRPPFSDAVAHYTKLLGRHTRLELIEVRDAAAAAARVPQQAFVSQLEVSGEALDSEELSEFLEARRSSGRDLCFVIGGPFGGLELPRTDHQLSLGRLTLPYQLTRVVLLEQIYRAHKILAGEPYHH